MKTCPRCGGTKPLDAFSKQTKSKDGRYPYCKICASARHREAYKARGRDSWLNDKTCNRCNQLLPRTAFDPAPNGRLKAQCRTCALEEERYTAQHLKQCNICREWLPHSRFHPSKLKYPRVGCVECTRQQTKGYAGARRAYILKKEYGITVEQYDELVAKQGGKCPICSVPFEPGDRSNPVDHAHAGPHSGRIRAILHNDCNRFVMWMHEDSRQLRAAADLIDNPLTDWYVPGVPHNQRRKDRQK